MKKIMLLQILLVLLSAKQLCAQREYWGVTFAGGEIFIYNNQQGVISNGLGVIYKTDKYGNNQQAVYSFDSATGIRPDGMLTDGGTGKLYGFASQGSSAGGGCLYEFDPVTYQYRVIKSFSVAGGFYNATQPGSNGGKPLLGTNGKLYGTFLMSAFVPVPGCPSCPPVLAPLTKIFEYNIQTDVFTEVYTFPAQTIISNGIMNGIRYAPGGPCRMMQAANGKMYISFQEGMETYNNFVTAVGRLYEFIPGINQVTLLYNYGLANGAVPGATMLEYSPGVMYNVFNYGSTEQMSKGGIHKYNVATNSMSIVAYVDTITGAHISGTLVKAGSKLYGTTITGGWSSVSSTPYYERKGIIFEFDPANNQIKKLYDFFHENQALNIDSVHNPYYPNPNYYVDFNGLSLNLLAFSDTLFGITKSSVFWYKISTGEFKSLLNFAGPNGYFPQTGTGLIQTCTKPYYTNLTGDTTILIQVGSPFSFTIRTPNSDSLRWRKESTFLNDTDSILNFNPVEITDTGRYSCSLINECGTVITKTIYLKTGTIIPVTLQHFRVRAENKNAILNWQTSAGYDYDYFEIERSLDGVNFMRIGKVNGNISAGLINEYQYTDHLTGRETKIFYRLKQVDHDGSYSYSSIEMVTVNPDAFAVTIVPNPATNNFTIHVNARPDDKITTSIYNSKGDLILQQLIAGGMAGINSSQWAAGQYIIKLTSNTGEIVTKIFSVNK